MKAFAVAAIALAGCAGETELTVIDGSSEETFVASAAAARSELPLDERLLFDRAINTVGGRSHRTSDVEQLRRRTFDGMTGAQVVEDARTRGIYEETR